MDSSTSSDERTWALLCHLSALAGFVVPFGNIIGPLLVWLLKREGSPLVDDQGKEALNFQLTATIALVVSAFLIFIVIGIPLFFAVALFDLIMIVIGGVRANNGEMYRYPINIRFVK